MPVAETRSELATAQIVRRGRKRDLRRAHQYIRVLPALLVEEHVVRVEILRVSHRFDVSLPRFGLQDGLRPDIGALARIKFRGWFILLVRFGGLLHLPTLLSRVHLLNRAGRLRRRLTKNQNETRAKPHSR